jgi:hypothetical protein
VSRVVGRGSSGVGRRSAARRAERQLRVLPGSESRVDLADCIY